MLTVLSWRQPFIAIAAEGRTVERAALHPPAIKSYTDINIIVNKCNRHAVEILLTGGSWVFSMLQKTEPIARHWSTGPGGGASRNPSRAWRHGVENHAVLSAFNKSASATRTMKIQLNPV